jgi:hypothetical protein
MADLEAPDSATPNPPAPPVAAPEPPAPVETAPPTEPEQEDIPDGAIEQGGQVMVPLAALKAEREQNKTLKGKAAQADQMTQWVNQARPYIDFLQANPDLMKQRQEPTQAPVAQTPAQDDPAAIDLARTLDLYTPEGQPDAKRALKIMTTVETLAERKAQAIVKPVQDQSLQEKAIANFHQAANSQLPNGQTVDRNVLWQIWSGGDPRVLSTPQGAAAAVALAYGMQHMQAAPAIQPPSQPPVVTESFGSRIPGAKPLTEMDQRVIQVRGMDPKKYAEHAKAFKPGETNQLED